MIFMLSFIVALRDFENRLQISQTSAYGEGCKFLRKGLDVRHRKLYLWASAVVIWMDRFFCR